MQGSPLSPSRTVFLCVLLVSLSGCHKAVPPAKGEPFAQVTEMRQRSVTEDPAVMGNFPNNWQLEKPSGPPMPPEESEIDEFQERLAKINVAPLVLEELAPGATRKVDLPLAGSPLATTGSTYHIGRDRGGSSLNAKTTAGGLATISVTNTSGVPVKLRIVLASSAL